MDIFLIRHGQSLSDAEKRWPQENEYKDVLTELGCQQAKLTGTFLKPLWTSESVVIASPLSRSMETAEIIVSQMEISKPIVILDERRSEIIIHRPGEMSFQEVAKRALIYFRELESDVKRVFCITHSFVIRGLATKSLKLENPMSIRLDNCGISYFMRNELITLNMVQHLKRNGADEMIHIQGDWLHSKNSQRDNT